MEQAKSVKVLEVCSVAPSQGTPTTTTNSSTPTRLPLTFYDLQFLRLPPFENLFFYEFSNPTTPSFFDSILPNLKHSLSLTLQHFLPFAGTIIWPLDSPHPIINYVPGNTVSLTISESNLDFNMLCSNTCEISQLHSLVPHLTFSHEEASVIALQVTLFPRSGFSLGIVSHHAAMDGKALMLFLKAWAYACANNQTNTSLLLSLPKHLTPFYDRSIIGDTTGIGATYAKNWLNFRGPNNRSMKLFGFGGAVPTEAIRGSFELTSSDIQKLKQHAKFKLKKYAHVSTFSVISAYVLQCLVKAEPPKTNGVGFIFSADCRFRMEPPVPSTYFGNCIVIHKVLDETKNLLGDDGFGNALMGISEALNRLEDGLINGALALNLNAWMEFSRDEKLITVAWSPQFETYSVDFGWGRPKKVDMTSIGKSVMFGLWESRNSGGLEISLVLEKQEMEAFSAHFTEGLESL
ncbi:hypothetical protein VNO78_33783 [Psophocarpus tetragonolobus]|uniref:Uncharacterized protein n=1 Tax=Psophocarpus tetragonolobus TaxID=3891 RepID=A0AAN9RPY3_PSOTE